MDPVNPSSPEPADETIQTQEPEKPAAAKPNPIIIRMWPKTPVLYPVAILALFCSLVGAWLGSSPQIRTLRTQYTAVAQQEAAPADSAQAAAPEAGDLESTVKRLMTGLAVDRVLGIIFLLVFAFSLLTLCVDLEVRWALIAFSVALALALALILLNQRYGFLPDVLSRLASLSPMANPQFYFAIFVIWVILMAISLAVVRFHYVKIESNEVIVVRGLLERQQRFPTIRMQYVKDIEDVLEYYLPLVRSGQLVLTFPDQRESVSIPTVINIEKVIARLDKISGVLEVHEKP